MDLEVCPTLLSLAYVGRIGVSVAALPLILSVNHVMHQGDVVFRTSSGTKLAAATADAVADVAGVSVCMWQGRGASCRGLTSVKGNLPDERQPASCRTFSDETPIQLLRPSPQVDEAKPSSTGGRGFDADAIVGDVKAAHSIDDGE